MAERERTAVSGAALAAGHQPRDERMRVPIGVLSAWIGLVLAAVGAAYLVLHPILPPGPHRNAAHTIERSGATGLVPWRELPAPPRPANGRAPALQLRPMDDLHELQQQQRERLRGYAWVDRDQGIARIPIERAAELLLQRGLPVRERAPQPPGEGAPGDTPNGGRR